MITRRLARSAALLTVGLVLVGCANSAAEPTTGAPEPGASDAGTTPPGSTAPSGSDDPAVASTELIGQVGTADDPEAYEIALTDADGTPVTSLPAGEYTLTFDDRSRMHNFRLTGAGVDVATDVQGSDSSTVTITLEPGTYTFVCDPHQGTMTGTVEVTG